jgi:hypothetical protein
MLEQVCGYARNLSRAEVLQSEVLVFVCCLPYFHQSFQADRLLIIRRVFRKDLLAREARLAALAILWRILHPL